jgi:hypothetical protein
MSLRPISECLAEAVAERKRDLEFPLVAIEGGYIVVYARTPEGVERHHTYMETSNLRTTDDALRWLEHLSEKTWVTTKHLRLAMQAIRLFRAH